MMDKFQTQKTEQDLLIINCGTIIINPDAVTPLLCTCSIISIEMKVVCHNPQDRSQLTTIAELLGMGLPAASIGPIHKKIFPHIKE